MRYSLISLLSTAILTSSGACMLDDPAAEEPHFEQETLHGTHCLTKLEPVDEAQDSFLHEYDCYDSFSQAILAATNGVIELPAGTKPGEISPEMVAALQAEGSTWLSTVFEHSDSKGASLTYVTSKSPSDVCKWYTLPFYDPSFDDSFWNDRISSVVGYNGCDTRLYEHTSYRGNTKTCSSDCESLGQMNDKASSLKIF